MKFITTFTTILGSRTNIAEILFEEDIKSWEIGMISVSHRTFISQFKKNGHLLWQVHWESSSNIRRRVCYHNLRQEGFKPCREMRPHQRKSFTFSTLNGRNEQGNHQKRKNFEQTPSQSSWLFCLPGIAFLRNLLLFEGTVPKKKGSRIGNPKDRRPKKYNKIQSDPQLLRKVNKALYKPESNPIRVRDAEEKEWRCNQDFSSSSAEIKKGKSKAAAYITMRMKTRLKPAFLRMPSASHEPGL